MQRTPRHFRFGSNTFIFVTVLTFLTSISCAPSAARLQENSASESNGSNPGPAPAPSSAIHLAIPALWETKAKDGAQWSSYAAQVIDSKCSAMIDGAKDMVNFCPKYPRLTHDQKINVWVYLVSAIAKYESGFSPTARLEEPGMGDDPITGQRVYSEGLLQLSYQDQIGYSYCNVFDWPVDKKLSATNPQKTILNPYLNLECGIQILNRQLERYGQIGIQSGAYWSTLRPSGTKLSLIKALVKGMGICQ